MFCQLINKFEEYKSNNKYLTISNGRFYLKDNIILKNTREEHKIINFNLFKKYEIKLGRYIIYLPRDLITFDTVRF